MLDATNGFVDESRRGTSLVISLNSAPLNLICADLRRDLDAALDRAIQVDFERVILTGSNTVFTAGADAKEFGQPLAPPDLPSLIAKLEKLPAIAAINGAALGGGLELALACRVRLCNKTAQLGLPEVKLGVIPGAGGTQRLPRLVGIATAASLIGEGKVIQADTAMEIGLVDAIVDDPVAAALMVDAEALIGQMPVSARATVPAAKEELDAVRRRIERKMGGQIAPLRAVKLVELSSTKSFNDAVEVEREEFLRLREGPQSAALRYGFFAERKALSHARKVATNAASCKTALVVGGGTMGSGIAFCLASAGLDVTVAEQSEKGLARADNLLTSLFGEAVKHGSLSEPNAQNAKAKVRLVQGFNDVASVDIAVEAVFEDLALKQKVFADLQKVCEPNTILATNTSYLDIDEVFTEVARKRRCIGLHFFSPANRMRLMEVIPGAQTEPSIYARAIGLALQLGKLPVKAGICDGFIGNRILARYRTACDALLRHGVMPWDVDTAMVKWGMAMGPYAVQDMSGLEIGYANRKRSGAATKFGDAYVAVADQLVENLGRLGKKSGAGWYDYPDGRKPQPAPDVERLVLASAWKEGIEPQTVSAEDIATHAVLNMLDEAVSILRDGVADRPEDVDLVLLHGYGFPKWRGGLFHMARAIGVAELELLTERNRFGGGLKPETIKALDAILDGSSCEIGNQGGAS